MPASSSRSWCSQTARPRSSANARSSSGMGARVPPPRGWCGPPAGGWTDAVMSDAMLARCARHLCRPTDARFQSRPASRFASEAVLRLQLDVPVEVVQPALVQVVGREAAAVVLQLEGRGPDRAAARMHVRLARGAAAL